MTIILAFSAVVVCCTKTAATACPEDTVRVTFRAGVPESRASSFESAVSSLDVLVFREGGTELEASARSYGSTLSVSVSKDVPLEFVLVANAPALAFNSCANLSQFNAVAMRLAQNRRDSFLMTGSGNFTAGSDFSLDVSLVRCVSKVSVGRVVTSFVSSLPFATLVTLNRIFLENVVDTRCYGSLSPGGWCNRMGVDLSISEPVFSFLDKEIGWLVIGEETISANAEFYCFPNVYDNGVTSATSPDWSPRNTRIVLEFMTDGNLEYYPITLPAMSQNVCYSVNEVILNGRGSSNPDIPVSGGTPVDNPPGEDDPYSEPLIADISITDWYGETIDALF